MAPTLYVIHASPPVRSVLVLGKALDIEFEEKFLDLLSGAHLKEEYLKINVQHTVPTLVEEDGYTLWDSHAIMPYLIAKYGKGDELYPKNDIKRRATIDQRLHFDSSVLFPRGLAISKSLVFTNETKIQPEAAANLKEGYEILEKLLGDNDWVVGNQISIADISLGTTVTSWDTMVPVQKEEFPKIAAWMERLQNVSYFKEGNQPGLDIYRTMIQSKLKDD